MDNVTRPSRRGRVLRSMLVGSLAATAAAVIATTGASAAPAGVSVLSITQYGPEAGGQRVQFVGELQNTGATVIGPLGVHVKFLDQNDNVLFEDSTTANVDALGSGERAPFILTEDTPLIASYTHYTYVVENLGGAVWNHAFTVAVTSRTNDGTYDHVVGTVTNNNTTHSDLVSVVGTAYSAANLALDVDSDYVATPNFDLAPKGQPGDSAGFELIFLAQRPYDHTAIVAQSTTASTEVAPTPAATAAPIPSPSAAPSSGPSAPSTGSGGTPANPPGGATGTGGPGGVTVGSPAPGNASVSPTPRASSTPPTTAGACSDSAGPYTIRLSPSSANVSKAGSVILRARLLQAGRPCQAGLSVVYYVRTKGTSVFHGSRTLTTDSQGLVSGFYAHPGLDFRWVARHGTASSGQGLVHVL